MSSKMLAVVTTAGLAATGLLGLGAATLRERPNPPATVKISPRSEAAEGHGYSAVVKRVLPAVVNISSSKVVKPEVGQRGRGELPDLDPFFRQFFGDDFFRNMVPQERREKALGSGVIVSPEGYILTNNHVIDGANEVTVTLHDKREMKARVVGTDSHTDIAVLKIEGSNFPYLTLGDSSKVEVGDIVLAIGNPFGIGETVTQGIVSATGRGGLGIEQLEDFIQTDAAINPGNSGGALVDDQGYVVGINTAIVGGNGGNVGIGFAVPINIAKHDMDSILQHGKVERGYLGVRIEDVTPALAKAFHTTATGALIGDVTADSPAGHAGLKPGDIVISVNGQQINSKEQLTADIGTMDPGSHANLKVLRDGKPMDVAVTLGSFPENEENASINRPSRGSEKGATGSLEGVTVENLTADTARQLKISPSTRGVVVTNVDQNSTAADAGLQE